MMIDPPSRNSGNAFWTVNSVPFALRANAASNGHVSSDLRDRCVQRLAPTAHDEDVGPFIDEELRPGERHTARRTGDDGDLPLELAHVSGPRAPVPS
ncbi:hypothetical protein DEJ28_16310 [Curtobacterium sp. MCPF17_002]|uniref:hypothetical protein n=1 Tax=Curtobacterium sp. MCPF17_002 TaxID=2175645 RepID=UPI001C64FE0E|nr:hypothetical protein [Curtobacterium sp. MCPF17_002]WIB79356.1 hypothetical protein DEJ28_16310 [Curtobacterium sp. MCPF17_002]